MQDVHTAIIHEKMYKKWRYVLDKVNNILCYGRIYFKHSIQTLTNFLSIYSRYWFHKRTKIRNTTFFFESSEDHTIFKEVSNTPSREGHIFSIILMDKLMWKILNTELSSTLLVWWVWAWRWSTEVFTGKLKGKSHHEAVGSEYPPCSNCLLYFTQVSSLGSGKQSFRDRFRTEQVLPTAATGEELWRRRSIWLKLGAEQTEMTFYYMPWWGLIIDLTSCVGVQWNSFSLMCSVNSMTICYDDYCPLWWPSFS